MSVLPLMLVPLALLLALPLLPRRWANGHASALRWGVPVIVAAVLGLAFAGLLLDGGRVIETTIIATDAPSWLDFTVRWDGVSSLVVLLVSFVGWLVTRYCVRYLDGDANQGVFFGWCGFTIAAVCLMVISGNLLYLAVAWGLTSFGLHHLLMHHGERAAARRAAWTKFAISRVGDAALVAAVVMTYRALGTLQIGQWATALPEADPSIPMPLIGCLFVLAAMTKSAQFPLHSWLPETMETPTPVSALMHAGIVNAGGFLIIRTSELMALAPVALSLLAVVGAVTACFAALVMLTQTSVKKTLAYSTVAQMGFMMLQCGLGAFSAAMLHLLAHSLYKAHAFLSSGSVIAEDRATAAVGHTETTPTSATPTALLSATAWVALVLPTTFWAAGLSLQTKPGGWLLGGVLAIALTRWLAHALTSHPLQTRLGSLAATAGLAVLYSFSFKLVDSLVAGSVAAVPVALSPVWISALILIGFAGLFAFEWRLSRPTGSGWVNKLQIHAANGFYLPALTRIVLRGAVR